MDPIRQISEQFNKFVSNLGNVFLSAGYITGLILGVIGMALLVMEIYYYYQVDRIGRWPVLKNAGTITDSYIESTSGSISYSILFVSAVNNTLYYRNRVSFTYNHNGKTYSSWKLSYYEPWDPNPMFAKIESDKYKPGTKVNIIINPNNPAEAYIINKPYANYSRLVLGIALNMVSLYIIYKS